MISGAVDFGVRMLPGVLLALAVYAALLPARRRKLIRSGQVSPVLREAALLVFVLFCGGLALLTLTPRWFHWLELLRGGQAGHPPYFTPGNAVFTPFHSFALDEWSLLIFLGNVVMFLPIGFFPSLLFSRFTGKKALATGLCTTLFIELSQLFIGRSFDVDDLMLNTLGVLLGHWLCVLLRRLAPQFTTAFEMRNQA